MAAPAWAFVTGFTIGTIRNPFDPTANVFWGAVSGAAASPTGRSFLFRVGSVIVSDIYIVGGAVMGTSTAGAIGTGITFGAAALGGAVIGAAVGTAISSVAFGQEGKQMAIDFYTGQSGAKWYEYIPHYNGYRIVRHYATEAIE